MSLIFNRLPKVLQYIVNEFLKDRTNYNILVKQFDGYVIASMDWMARPNLDSVVKFMLVQRKKDIITRNNIWYADIKKLKKPHGKRPPTIRSDHDKYILRFGSKNLYNFRRNKRNKRPQTYMSFLSKAHTWIKTNLPQLK